MHAKLHLTSCNALLALDVENDMKSKYEVSKIESNKLTYKDILIRKGKILKDTRSLVNGASPVLIKQLNDVFNQKKSAINKKKK